MNLKRGGWLSIEVAIAGLAFLALGVGLISGSVLGWTLFAAAGSSFVRPRIQRMYRPRARQQPIPRNAVILGEDDSGASVFLTDDQLAAHGLILGATGSGKTTSLMRILCDAVGRDLPVVAIDLKGSREFADQLAAAAESAGRRFDLWRLGGSGYHWNPLQHGDATELKDKLISFEQFTEPHYQRAAERYLQTAIQLLQAARPGRPVTLAAVVNVLDPANLKALLPHVDPQIASRVGPYLANLTRDQRSAVSGVQSRLALLSESTTGAFLQPGERDNTCDLMRALTGGSEVVLFSLNASRYGKLAAQIAALVIQDLVAIAGYRQELSRRPLALVAIDEFSALDADNLLSLLARARQAGMSVLLCTQELADLERVTPRFRDQVLGNVAITIAHRQNVPDSAELIAKMIGTQTVWKYTQAVHRRPRLTDIVSNTYRAPTTLGSKREVEEFRIHPNVIKELPTGRAVLVTKLPVSSARLVSVSPPMIRQRQAPEVTHVG